MKEKERKKRRGRRGRRKGRRGEGKVGEKRERERRESEKGREREWGKENRHAIFHLLLISIHLERVTDLQNVPGLLAVKGVHILVALRGPQNLHSYIYSLWG